MGKTIAQSLIEKGKEEGIAQGITQGITQGTSVHTGCCVEANDELLRDSSFLRRKLEEPNCPVIASRQNLPTV